MKKYWWMAAFIVSGILFVTGILLLVTRPPRGTPVVLLPPPTPAMITVYVDGAVTKAGLYLIPPGSRVNDAIQAAGGFRANAMTGQLNLAKILTDGEEVFVPEPMTLSPADRGNAISNANTALIDINTATQEQLEELPEIGPKTAQAIIDYRNANGPFKRIEDIMDVPRIGEAIFDAIQTMITVGVAAP